MNCKQGDLAVIVRSYVGNEGKIVECQRVEAHHHVYPGGVFVKLCWFIGRPLLGWRDTQTFFVPDEFLRPLRDTDGEDEMLRLAGLPAGEPQEA